MTLSYQLTATGYQILADGQVWVDQPFKAGTPGFVPYTEAEAQAEAEAFIADYEAEQAAAAAQPVEQ